MTRFSILMLLALSCATASASLAAPVRLNPDEYRNRDGEKEANDDLRHGKPLKLYYSWQWGEGLRLPVAGVRFCDADSPKDARKAKAVFVSLPALEYAEDRRYTSEEHERQLSAWKFARTYNLTMWRHKKSEIHRLCPYASVGE
jgi:hypothetical protein